MQASKKGGLGGLIGGKNYNLVEYYETVEKSVDLSFNLSAKYLPVIYGTQFVGGIPIFADTDKNNPNTVWVVYAVCEGEIEGFLDIHIDDKPLICID
ncbi:tail fiber protein [Aeromonas phage Akh-2]|nr:tail fiber protein [Aeromonas phage Akh-2]